MHRPDFRRAARLSRCIPFVVLIVAACLATSSASAQSGSVVLEHSRVYVFVAKKGAGHDHGVEGRLASGEIHLDRADEVGKLVFDLRTFGADTNAARQFFKLPGETPASTQAEVNENMHGTAVLDIGRFPTAEFSITRLRSLTREVGQAGRPYQLDGELTLHGVKRPLQITATAETVDGGLVRLRGRFALKQTDFGIKPFSKLLGVVGVVDELQVYGDLYLRP